MGGSEHDGLGRRLCSESSRASTILLAIAWFEVAVVVAVGGKDRRLFLVGDESQP